MAERADYATRFKKGNPGGGRKSFANGGKPGPIQLANKLLEDALPEIVKSVIESALAGDMAASKMIFDKKLASLKTVELQGIDSSKLPRMIVNATKEYIDAEIVQPGKLSKDKVTEVEVIEDKS